MAARDERIIAVGSDPDVRDHELLPGAPLPTDWLRSEVAIWEGLPMQLARDG